MSQRAVIIGCGGVGSLVAAGLVAQGVQTIGVRRRVGEFPAGVWPQQGDARDQEIYHTINRRFGEPDRVAITANPGFRGGGNGNGLDVIAQTVHRLWPHARLVYTGSTAVYADSGGRWVDESGCLATSLRAQNLLAIEAAVAQQQYHLILRAGALGGIERARRSPRLNSGQMQVRGPAWRSLSWIHEQDLAQLVVRGLNAELGVGIANAVADEHPSVASFHRRHASELGLTLSIHGGTEPAPERRIRCTRLHAAGQAPIWRPWWK